MSRKIDALVAEHVFDYHVYFSRDEFCDASGKLINDYRMREKEGSYREFVPPYSTDIALAWDIVDEMDALNWRITKKQGRTYEVSVNSISNLSIHGYSRNRNLALCICLSALQAKGVI